MEHITLLDCTLRDGGYCNNWMFGKSSIKKLIKGLSESEIDIIECGFLTEKADGNINQTKFISPCALADYMPERKQSIYLCMINYGEFNIDSLPNCHDTILDGIRIAFHKNDMKEALRFCECVAEKGYKVFVQPMVSLSYTDAEFLELIKMCNKISPYAFYIVDSFGVMKKSDLIRLFYLIDHNLSTEIAIGYHAHNNMQMAYANAQTLADIKTNRNIIIDATVFGMGRGAGNLNTELFAQYLNDCSGSNYKIKPLLNIIDEILYGFYKKNYWGYSLPNYLSASYNIHPNYALYLTNKETLTVEDMNEIFSAFDDKEKVHYNIKYIEELYKTYMLNGQTQEERLDQLSTDIKNKTVLIIAPGSTSFNERERICAFAAQDNVISIGINQDYEFCACDYIFLSNRRRFKNIDSRVYHKCIVTSNIDVDNVFLKTDYEGLLNQVEYVTDNAGLMLIKFLINLGVRAIRIAGMDGYRIDEIMPNEDFNNSEKILIGKNEGISKMLKVYKQYADIRWITSKKFIDA